MRKFSLILVIFMFAAPALADVTIEVEDHPTDPCSFNITYEITGGEDVRAFALDIYVVGDINIVEVNDFHAGESDQDTAKGYGIFPSSFASEIDPEDPDWDDSGYTPLGDEADYPEDTLGGLDTNGITVELGSLYVGGANQPDDSGILLKIVLENDDAEKICPALNLIRGGVVLEDGNSPSVVNLICYEDVECLIGGNAPLEYASWVQWGKPNCWCYARQCRGDIDGKQTGPFWVAIPDLGVFANAYGKLDGPLAGVTNGICADLDHRKTGPFRVAIPDLGIFANYYGRIAPPIPLCNVADATNPVYPGVLYTGPYNFWAVPE